MFCDTAVSKLIDKHIEQYYVRCAIHSINLYSCPPFLAYCIE